MGPPRSLCRTDVPSLLLLLLPGSERKPSTASQPACPWPPPKVGTLWTALITGSRRGRTSSKGSGLLEWQEKAFTWLGARRQAAVADIGPPGRSVRPAWASNRRISSPDVIRPAGTAGRRAGKGWAGLGGPARPAAGRRTMAPLCSSARRAWVPPPLASETPSPQESPPPSIGIVPRPPRKATRVIVNEQDSFIVFYA